MEFKELNDKIEKVRSALKSDDSEEVKKQTEELSKSAQRVGGELYKQPEQAASAQESSGEPKEESKDAK